MHEAFKPTSQSDLVGLQQDIINIHEFPASNRMAWHNKHIIKLYQIHDNEVVMHHISKWMIYLYIKGHLLLNISTSCCLRAATSLAGFPLLSKNFYIILELWLHRAEKDRLRKYQNNKKKTPVSLRDVCTGTLDLLLPYTVLYTVYVLYMCRIIFYMIFCLSTYKLNIYGIYFTSVLFRRLVPHWSKDQSFL
ncbi:hypothetical protein ACJX0J_019729, partial [Zea mays]